MSSPHHPRIRIASPEKYLPDEGTEASPRMPTSESIHRKSESCDSIPEDVAIESVEEASCPTTIPENGPVEPSRPSPPPIPPAPVLPPSPASNSPTPRSSKFQPFPWSDFFDKEEDVKIPGTENVFHVYSAGKSGPVVFCLHGGGYSGLSFALAAREMKSSARVVAMDLRGHGSSSTDDDEDLSAQTLCGDVVAVIQALFGEDPPSIVLVGHSMGGAIAIRTASENALPSLAGLVVVDVVEGTAMASLAHMRSILAARPLSFPSPQKAIEWSLRSGHLRNLDSARASIPSTLVKDSATERFVWRTPLQRSEEFWKGWYEGLSESFLRCPVAKLLLLAGTDRLDKALTIAQMQGKFQMLLVRHAGHAIQEDEPEEFSMAVLNFLSRNRIGEKGLTIGKWGGQIHP